MNGAQHAQLAEVASMYYEREMTQAAIADELGLSRVKVYRLLKEARDQNVVQIFVDWPVQRDEVLEQALADTFGLQSALVLQSSPNARISSRRRSFSATPGSGVEIRELKPAVEQRKAKEIKGQPQEVAWQLVKILREEAKVLP